MKKQILSLAVVAGAIQVQAYCKSTGHTTAKKPNIIYILADDLGYSELGCYGNTFNESPNINKLAKDGVRLTQAYVAAPVCSPSRAALLTGQYPARIGITDYLRPDAGQFLDTAYVTLPEALKANGYHTGIVGKWHLSGYTLENAPIQVLPDKQGFDEVITSEIMGIGNGTYFWPYDWNPTLKKKLKTEHEFLTDRMNLEAVEFIEKNQDKPFFLYLSHYACHTMLHGKPEYIDYFRRKPGAGKGDPSKENPGNDPYKKWPADYFVNHNNPHLAAMLKSVDDGVGMIRAKLRELGIDKNTIIVFTSDNGGETRVTSNAPLRGGKSMLYEGGFREPLIIYDPGKIEGGKVIDVPVSNYDFYPTLCELTGTKLPENEWFDGKSIVPVLLGKKDKTLEDRVFYWHYPLDKPHFLGGRSAGAIRHGDWKYIEYFDNGEKELFNLKDDPGETNNRINESSQKAKQLQDELNTWRNDVLNNKHIIREPK